MMRSCRVGNIGFLASFLFPSCNEGREEQDNEGQRSKVGFVALFEQACLCLAGDVDLIRQIAKQIASLSPPWTSSTEDWFI